MKKTVLTRIDFPVMMIELVMVGLQASFAAMYDIKGGNNNFVNVEPFTKKDFHEKVVVPHKDGYT